MLNGRLEWEEVGSIVRWGLVLGTFLVTVTTITSCVQRDEDQSKAQLSQLIAEGYDPVISRCAVYGSSLQDASGINCALAIQAQAFTGGKMPAQQEAP
jgi:hypothetical protein